jgi:hypothetical protein
MLLHLIITNICDKLRDACRRLEVAQEIADGVFVELDYDGR